MEYLLWLKQQVIVLIYQDDNCKYPIRVRI